jgi:proline dehydrogenase
VTTLLRGPILWATELAWVRRTVTQHNLGRRLAGRFVAGATLEDGMLAARSLADRGIGAMLDHLGENVESPAHAAAATDSYIAALKRIRESPELEPAPNISVKLTQLGLDLSVDLCMENMEHVLQVASETDPPTLVMIDMEARGYVDPTLDVYVALRERYQHTGVCLQAYLFRTGEDAARIAGPLTAVRMAKGAYLEPPESAYQRMPEIRKNYARLASTLLVRGSTVHLATHDPHLVTGARSFVHRAGIAPERYEFQMLYGIRRDLQAELVEAGEPVRVYVPYGTEWYPYLTRRMAERPANLRFFLTNLLRWRT